MRTMARIAAAAGMAILFGGVAGPAGAQTPAAGGGYSAGPAIAQRPGQNRDDCPTGLDGCKPRPYRGGSTAPDRRSAPGTGSGLTPPGARH